MVYRIVKYPDPVLETPAAPVVDFGSELSKLIHDMFDTMWASKGVGLAAPQIGLSMRLAVIDTSAGENPSERLVLINPEIIFRSGSQTSEEGCLSIPTFRENVTRPMIAKVRAQNPKGEFFETTGEELLARAILHETDHLNGILFINYLSPLKRDLIKRKIRKLQKSGEWD